MMRRFRDESGFVIRRLGGIVGAAFGAGFLGTLVWINGRAAWFVMRFADLPEFAPSLSLAYTLWLMVYGLFGAGLFLCAMFGGKNGGRTMLNGAVLFGGYLLALLWQPFFYSAYFLYAAFAVLALSFGMVGVFLVRVCLSSFWLTAAGALILLIEGYFIIFTVSCF